MKNPRIMYAPTCFAVAVSKSRRKLQHTPANQRRPRSLPEPEASRKKQEKGSGSHFANLGVGSGRKTPTSSHNVSFYTQIYQVGHTRDTQQDPISTFYFPRQNRGGSCKYTNRVRQLWDPDRLRQGLFLILGGWYITGMTEAFCESCFI